MLTYLTLILGVAVLVVASVILLKIHSLGGGKASNEALGSSMADVGERIQRSSAEIKQALGDRIETQLAKNRQELQTGLSSSTEALEKKFKSLEEKTEKQLEGIRVKVDERLAAIGKDVQEKLERNMKESFQHFQKFQDYMKAAEVQLKNVGTVGDSINELNSLLRLPHLRGKFGETTLELLLNSFLPADLYEIQANMGENGAVDALIKFPEASLPIDSKFPREQILPLFDTCDKAAIEEARKKLRTFVQVQSKKISKYIAPEKGTTDFALMYLPSETIYFEIISNGDIWNEMAAQKVYPVSPNTLAIMLKSIYLAYKNYQTAQDVKKTIKNIEMAGKHFTHFKDRFDDIGEKLVKAQESYRIATSHLDRYSSSAFKLTGGEQPAIESGEDAGKKEEN